MPLSDHETHKMGEEIPDELIESLAQEDQEVLKPQIGDVFEDAQGKVTVMGFEGDYVVIVDESGKSYEIALFELNDMKKVSSKKTAQGESLVDRYEKTISESQNPELMREYIEWVEREGHLTPSSNSVLGEFIRQKGLGRDEHDLLARGLGLELSGSKITSQSDFQVGDKVRVEDVSFPEDEGGGELLGLEGEVINLESKLGEVEVVLSGKAGTFFFNRAELKKVGSKKIALEDLQVGDKVKVIPGRFRAVEPDYPWSEDEVLSVSKVEGDDVWISDGVTELGFHRFDLEKVGSKKTATSFKLGDDVKILETGKSGKIFEIRSRDAGEELLVKQEGSEEAETFYPFHLEKVEKSVLDEDKVTPQLTDTQRGGEGPDLPVDLKEEKVEREEREETVRGQVDSSGTSLEMGNTVKMIDDTNEPGQENLGDIVRIDSSDYVVVRWDDGSSTGESPADLTKVIREPETEEFGSKKTAQVDSTGAPLQEGDPVRIGDAYGGGFGTIESFAPSGLFGVVSKENGERASFTLASLTKVSPEEFGDEDDDDDFASKKTPQLAYRSSNPKILYEVIEIRGSGPTDEVLVRDKSGEELIFAKGDLIFATYFSGKIKPGSRVTFKDYVEEGLRGKSGRVVAVDSDKGLTVKLDKGRGEVFAVPVNDIWVDHAGSKKTARWMCVKCGKILKATVGEMESRMNTCPNCGQGMVETAQDTGDEGVGDTVEIIDTGDEYEGRFGTVVGINDPDEDGQRWIEVELNGETKLYEPSNVRKARRKLASLTQERRRTPLNEMIAEDWQHAMKGAFHPAPKIEAIIEHIKKPVAKIESVGTSFYELWLPMIHSGLSPDSKVLRGFKIKSSRNFDHSGECPVQYTTKQISAKENARCIADGILFITSSKKKKLAIQLDIDSWSGVANISVYHDTKCSKLADGILDRLRQHVQDTNIFKGQAFTAQGKFIKTGNLTWKDLILGADQKKEIKSNVYDFVEKQEILKKNRIPTKRGLMFIGPPGTGKTLTGKILANELPKRYKTAFMWVTPVDVSCPEEIQRIYGIARELKKCCVLLEDIDLVARGRDMADGWTGPQGMILGELLNQLDGVEVSDGVITIATSNYPEVIEKALKDRPGRFDRRIYFSGYDKKSDPGGALRKEFLDRVMGHRKTSKTYNPNQLLNLLEGMTGAEIQEVINTAVITAIDRDSLTVEKQAILSQVDLLKGIDTVREGRKVGRKKVAQEEIQVGDSVEVSPPNPTEEFYEVPTGSRGVVKQVWADPGGRTNYEVEFQPGVGNKSEGWTYTYSSGEVKKIGSHKKLSQSVGEGSQILDSTGNSVGKIVTTTTNDVKVQWDNGTVEDMEWGEFGLKAHNGDWRFAGLKKKSQIFETMPCPNCGNPVSKDSRDCILCEEKAFDPGNVQTTPNPGDAKKEGQTIAEDPTPKDPTPPPVFISGFMDRDGTAVNEGDTVLLIDSKENAKVTDLSDNKITVETGSGRILEIKTPSQIEKIGGKMEKKAQEQFKAGDRTGVWGSRKTSAAEVGKTYRMEEKGRAISFTILEDEGDSYKVIDTLENTLSIPKDRLEEGLNTGTVVEALKKIPQTWWQNAINKARTFADDPEKFAGSLYYHFEKFPGGEKLKGLFGKENGVKKRAQEEFKVGDRVQNLGGSESEKDFTGTVINTEGEVVGVKWDAGLYGPEEVTSTENAGDLVKASSHKITSHSKRISYQLPIETVAKILPDIAKEMVKKSQRVLYLSHEGPIWREVISQSGSQDWGVLSDDQRKLRVQQWAEARFAFGALRPEIQTEIQEKWSNLVPSELWGKRLSDVFAGKTPPSYQALLALGFVQKEGLTASLFKKSQEEFLGIVYDSSDGESTGELHKRPDGIEFVSEDFDPGKDKMFQSMDEVKRWLEEKGYYSGREQF